MGWPRAFTGWWRSSDPRSEREIDQDIADEIEFHLAQRTRELEEQGLGEAESRAEAERRFGSVEDVRRRCRWIHLGERIMLQRIHFVLSLVLVTAILLLGWNAWRNDQRDGDALARMQKELHKLSGLLEPRVAALAPEAAHESSTRDRLIERFRSLPDVRAAEALAAEIAAVDPETGCGLVQDGWAFVADPRARIAQLAPFVTGGGHAQAIEILHLAVTDPDAQVREQAFQYLKSYAWQDFSGKPLSLYQEWFANVRGKSIRGALEYSVEQYHWRLRAAQGAELVREMHLLDEIDLQPATLRGFDALHDLWWNGGEAGSVNERAPAWLATDDPELQLAALQFVSHFRLEPEFVEMNVLGVLTTTPWKSNAHAIAACRALAACGQVRTTLEIVARQSAESDLVPNRLSALVLRLLRLCIEQDTDEVRRVVGAGVLAPLLQLVPDPARAAPQWSAWWKEHRTQFASTTLLESADARWLDQH